MRKRWLAIFMCSLMVMSLIAGCSSDNEGNNGDGSGSNSDGADGDGRMTLELWTSNREAIENEDAWYVQKIENDFDVNIEMKYRNEGSTDYSEWLTLSMAGDDAPDWFRDQTINLTVLNDFIDQGLVAELDVDMVKEAMPNYMEWTQKYSNVFGADPFSIYAVDGKVYAIPDAKVDLTRFCIMAYRQDWLDNLGMEAPTTLDEFTETMRAFTFDDPDGDGVDDTYGYIGITGDTDWAFSPIFAAFGTYPGIWYVKDDGTVTRGEIEPGTKEALKYIKSLYDMGVVDPEWMTIDFEQAKNKVVSSVVGSSWQNWLTILTPDGWWSALQESEPDATWAVTKGIEGANGNVGVMQFNPLAGVGLVFSKHMEDQPEKMKKYLEVFDAIAGDPAWHEAEVWGVENETYTIDDAGTREYIEGYADEANRVDYGFSSAYRFPTLEQFQYDPDVHDAIEFTAEINAIRQETLGFIEGKYDILGNFYLPIWADVNAELPDMNVIFAEMITGDRDIEEFDSIVQEWMDKGGREALDEAQAIYDERFQ